MLALPLVIPYDGHEYIDFAGVLFSYRFPRDWQPPIRTPGHPLALKAAFAVLGRQPLAIVVINAVFAWVMLLAMAGAARLLAGPVAAAAVVAIVVVFPLSVAYQHHALTESGMAAWLALVVLIPLVPDRSPRAGWWKAAALAGALTAGYYHRQSLQLVAPVAAILFALGALRAIARHSFLHAQAGHRPSGPPATGRPAAGRGRRGLRRGGRRGLAGRWLGVRAAGRADRRTRRPALPATRAAGRHASSAGRG